MRCLRVLHTAERCRAACFSRPLTHRQAEQPYRMTGPAASKSAGRGIRFSTRTHHCHCSRARNSFSCPHTSPLSTNELRGTPLKIGTFSLSKQLFYFHSSQEKKMFHVARPVVHVILCIFYKMLVMNVFWGCATVRRINTFSLRNSGSFRTKVCLGKSP